MSIVQDPPTAMDQLMTLLVIAENEVAGDCCTAMTRIVHGCWEAQSLRPRVRTAAYRADHLE